MVLRPDGRRYVLLPPSRFRCCGLSRGQFLHAPKTAGPVTDPYTTSVQWSRRFIGLKLFLALAHYGESGYSEMIEHQTRMGDVLRESLKARGLADRQQHAAAAGVLHPRRAGHRFSFWRPCMRGRSRGCRKFGYGNGAPVLRACITSFRTTEVGHQRCSQRVSRSEMSLPDGYSMRRETIAIHGGYQTDPTTKAVAVPIYQTVAYEFDSADHAAALFNLEAEGYRYSRISNPTTAVLERRVAALEGGLEALCVSTGQAATYYATLNVTELGTNIVSVPQLYGTTHTLFAYVCPARE
jgi:hypothetical protein